MMSNTSQTEAPSIANRGNVPGIVLSTLQHLWIVPAVALLCLAIFLSVGRTKLSESGLQLIVILVYSALIAPPSAIVCNWIGRRFSEMHSHLVILLYALALFCTATTGTLAGALVLQWTDVLAHGLYWAAFRGSWPFSIVITLVVGLSISAIETLRFKLQAATLEVRTRQVEHERAKKLLAETRLASLESSIHPHFLFNTLNSIAALIPRDPQRAEDTVGKLASLLRFSLNAQHSGLVPLSQELKLVSDYLEIESTRFGKRLRYEIAVPDSLGSFKVPPMSVQTLVENSVKHVAAQRVDGASIRITGQVFEAEEEQRICLEVADDGAGFSLDNVTPAHGLSNLIARLELLYGAEGRLEVACKQEGTFVSISFPAEL